jgi:3-deoxy-D-manno-octulosonic-acid transferase
VPHRVDSASLATLEEYLQDLGRTFVRTTSLTHLKAEVDSEIFAQADGILPDRILPNCILVDEMGFLSELYSSSDWAFVGGGFGAGIHSTIEPAIYGVPVAGGPRGASQFSEIQHLTESGQYTQLKTSDELIQWVKQYPEYQARKQEWILQAQERCGAAQKIMSFLRDEIESPK